MAGVRDKVAFACDSVLDARQHLVEGVAESRDLVGYERDREALIERGARNLLCSSAHCLDRAKRSSRNRVAPDRREDQRKRTPDEERGQQASKSLRPVLSRR